MSFDPGILSTIANPGTWSSGATPVVAPSVNWGSIGGAASTAIGTTAQLISQAAQGAAQRDFSGQQGALDRATQAALARMHLSEAKYESDNTAKANAYRMMLAALSGQMDNEGATFANKRNASNATDQLLASAMLRR